MSPAKIGQSQAEFIVVFTARGSAILSRFSDKYPTSFP
jgi:hypothetical protein